MEGGGGVRRGSAAQWRKVLKSCAFGQEIEADPSLLLYLLDQREGLHVGWPTSGSFRFPEV